MNKIKYEQLRQVIIKAVPEIMDREIKIQNILEPYFVCLDGRDNEPANNTIIEISKKLNKITIADVLLTWEKNDKQFLKWHLEAQDLLNTLIAKWNLKNNSLDWHWKNQKETVDFLFNLLV